ncbi:hypothetical protein DSECCO2_592420 [anaerobic digester metagenome]
MYQGQHDTDGDACEARRGLLVGGEEDGQHQERGEHHLDDHDRSELVATGGVVPVAVGTESAGDRVEAGGAAGDHEQDPGGQNTTDDLGDHVEKRFLPLDLLGHEHAQRDRGVDVASGYRTDGIGHHQQGEAERQCYSQITHVSTREHGRSHTTEDQHEGPDDLGHQFLQDSVVHEMYLGGSGTSGL